MGIMELLGVAFIILKLMGYLDWSWFWVTAPLWAGLAISFFVFVCAAGGSILMSRRFR